MSSDPREVYEVGVLSNDIKLMVAMMFVSSRKPLVPTFGFQLHQYDPRLFADRHVGKKVLESLAAMNLLSSRRTVMSSKRNYVPVDARGDNEGFFPTEKGTSILCAAYHANSGEMLFLETEDSL